MAILTNDNSLAWTLSDNTSGSNKSKRGGGKIKAVTAQDTWTNSISKYLGASAKMDHDNAARQFSFQEQQLKLEERKMAFQEEQLEYQKRMEQQQYHGRGYGYGIAYGEPRSHVSPSIPVRQDHQPYNRYGHGIAHGGQRSDHQPNDHYGYGIAYGGQRSDHQSNNRYGYGIAYGGQRSDHQPNDRYGYGIAYGGPKQDNQYYDQNAYGGPRQDHEYYRFREREKLLQECLARGGDNYYEICDLLSMSHSGQGSSSKFKSPKMDDSFDASHQSATINLTGSKGGYVK